MDQLPETLHCIYDPNWFPENCIFITEVPSEIIQKMKIDHENIKIINHNAKNQPSIFKNITENTNTSLEWSILQKRDSKVHHDGPGISTVTNSGFSQLRSGEPTTFTPYFFLVIGRITPLFCERHKLTDGTNLTTEFITTTPSTKKTAVATATASFSTRATTITAVPAAWWGCCGTVGSLNARSSNP